jgi:hypothetical protein
MKRNDPKTLLRNCQSLKRVIYKPQWVLLYRYKLISIIFIGICISIFTLFPLLYIKSYGELIINWVVHLIILTTFLFGLCSLYLRYNKFAFTLYVDGFDYSYNVLLDLVSHRCRFIGKEDIISIKMVTSEEPGVRKNITRIKLKDSIIDLDDDDIDNPTILMSWFYQ